MTEREAIAMVFGISIAQAEEIYVDDIPDDVYEDILKLMNEESDRRN